jgi:hypothetical protein
LRLFQLHLTETHVRPPTINGTVTALRFFFSVTVDWSDVTKPLTFVAEPRKLPVILSPEEVSRFLEAAATRRGIRPAIDQEPSPWLRMTSGPVRTPRTTAELAHKPPSRNDNLSRWAKTRRAQLQQVLDKGMGQKPIHFAAGNLSPSDCRLLQHNLPVADMVMPPPEW